MVGRLAGRILRSQVERRACYRDVLQVVQITGVAGNLDALVKTVAFTLIGFRGKYYRWALIRQTLRTFRRYYYRLGVDFALLATIPYTQIVRPKIKSFLLPYAPDDGQAIQITWQQDTITARFKLPQKAQPMTRSNWKWQSCALIIPPNIYQRISNSTCQLQQPRLRYLYLKGGLQLPFLELSVLVPVEKACFLSPDRVLATDLGVINLTTSVICEAGSQLSQPLFWSPKKRLLHKIDALYHHVAHLQNKLACYPAHWVGQGKRAQEQKRLYAKLNRYRALILRETSNVLLDTAVQWGCPLIVLEDLRTYDPPKHKHQLSRKLSNWLRGSLYDILVYKARRVGIRVKRVAARWTSSYCSRCGCKGQKISDPSDLRATKTGRFFCCPSCQYRADRDYIGAVNIYRMYQESKRKRYSLRAARPVSYTGAGIPPNRPGGASAHLRMGG
jgi:IS605 OrfB family transposase